MAARLPQADPCTDLDAILAATMPAGYGYDSSYDLAGDPAAAQFLELSGQSFAREQARIEQDAAPLAVRSEDRLAVALGRIGTGTFTPAGYAAYSFASQGGTTGMETCGTADDLGYCMERFHAPGCGSAATPDIVEGLREQMELTAMRPWAGEDGLVWTDRRVRQRHEPGRSCRGRDRPAGWPTRACSSPAGLRGS